MKTLRSARTLGAGERGGVLVLVAVLLPVLILMASFVVDVGNWFEHKRHLQLQADAGALAAGGAVGATCSLGDTAAGNTLIEGEARKYAGDPTVLGAYNSQVGNANLGDVTIRINRKTFEVGGPGPDDTIEQPPCEASMIDVKATEAGLPWFFRVGSVEAINAHARVAIESVSTVSGGLPIAVPDVDPKQARAFFVDESTGLDIPGASVELTKGAAVNGLSTWSNDGAPVAVTINTAANPAACPSRGCIGVRIALSGGTSTTCGDPLVECYETGTTKGLVYVRGYSQQALGAGAQPIPLARDVRLFNGSCTDPYFSYSAATCTIGVRANVDFGVANPVANPPLAKVRATVDGVTKALTYDPTTSSWASTGNNFFDVDPGAGPLPVTLSWEENAGTMPAPLGACSNNSNKNPCKGTFGVVQRVFSGSPELSGPIKLLQVWENGSFWANSFPTSTTPRDLVVKLGVTGNLEVAQTAGDPTYILRVASASGSQNQALDCDVSVPNFRTEIANGCQTPYQINPGVACPNATLPLNCVPIATGDAVGQLRQGMNDRFGTGANCVPNNWPTVAGGDPRAVPIFITPYGSFQNNGNEHVPVLNFAIFYITGWDGDNCASNEAYPEPGSSKGNIWGHFIKYTLTASGGSTGSGNPCNFQSITPCVAVLTR